MFEPGPSLDGNQTQVDRDINSKFKLEFTLQVGMETKIKVMVVAKLQVRVESEIPNGFANLWYTQ